MDRVHLKHTDLEVSRLCFGTMTFGGRTGADEAARMVGHCLDNGVEEVEEVRSR